MIFTIFLAVIVNAAAVAAIYFAVLGIKKIVEKIGEKLQNNKNHKVYFMDAQDISEQILKNEKMAKTYSEKELANALGNCSHILVTTDKDTKSIKDVEYMKVDKVDDDLQDWLDNNDGWIMVEG